MRKFIIHDPANIEHYNINNNGKISFFHKLWKTSKSIQYTKKIVLSRNSIKRSKTTQTAA